MRYCISIFATLLFSVGAVTGDEITLRDGETTIVGKILGADVNGFRIESEEASLGSTLLPLSSIKSFSTSQARPSLDSFLLQGDEIWRAKVRLQRGDVFLASPIFFRYSEQFQNSSSEDARAVSEGALRCAIAIGNLREAFDPWMRTAKHRADGFDSAFPNLTKVLDSTSLLCPQLPPIFLLEDGVRAIPLPDTPSGNTGKRFLETLLQVSKGDSDEMESLLSELNTFPQWKQAWAQYFLAFGYFQQKDDPDSNDKGLLALARVASLPKNVQPWLTGASLIALSERFALDGKIAISEKMLRQLQRNYPTHPLLQEGITKIRNARE